MMVLHNFGNAFPPDAEYSNSPPLRYANAHPAFPGVVEIIDTTTPERMFSKDGGFAFPPSPLLASMLTKTARISASLTAGGISISVSGDLANYFVGTVETIGERLGYSGSQDHILFSEDTGFVSDKRLLLGIDLGKLSEVQWNRVESKWVWPLLISISYSTLDPLEIFTIRRGAFGDVVSANPEAGVSVSFFGESITLYGKTNDDLGKITGSITIEAEEYLDPL